MGVNCTVRAYPGVTEVHKAKHRGSILQEQFAPKDHMLGRLVLCCCLGLASTLLLPSTSGLRLAVNTRPRYTTAHATLPVDGLTQPLLPSLPLLLLADDVFKETFKAGMALALSGALSTILLGIIVNSKYSDVEASYFDAQDEAGASNIRDERVDEEVVNFFGDDLNPKDTERKEASQQ